jgi:hypothetical protein
MTGIFTPVYSVSKRTGSDGVPDLLGGEPRRHRSGVVPGGWVGYLLACRAKACLLVLVGGCHDRAS